MFLGFLSSFHFMFELGSADLISLILYTSVSFVICWPLLLLGLRYVLHHKFRLVAAVLPLSPVIAIIVWMILMRNSLGFGAIIPALFIFCLFPGIVFSMFVGYFLLRHNGWKIATVVIVLGVAWVGYAFSHQTIEPWQSSTPKQSTKECKNVAEAFRYDCYIQVAVTNKDVGICESSFKATSGEYSTCYAAVGKATNNTTYCATLSGDTKYTCYKEIAINTKSMESCENLPETSGVEGGATYRQDCYLRIFEQLAVPTTSSSVTDVAQWCKTPKLYPAILNYRFASLQSTYSQYCK